MLPEEREGPKGSISSLKIGSPIKEKGTSLIESERVKSQGYSAEEYENSHRFSYIYR